MVFAAFIGALGTAFGSFLNVVAYRVPRGESLIAPPSHCPNCNEPIKARDNIPVLSWIMLRGRCRSCHVAISPRYPLIEALCGVLCVAAVLASASVVHAALSVVLIFVLVPAAAIDLEYRRIPNLVTGAGALAAIVVGAALDPSGEPTRLIAGAVAGGFLLLAALAYPAGMGMGDVKLAGVMGLCLGVAVAPAMFIALIAGVAVGIAMMSRGASRKTAVPFGPFLALGGLVAIFAGAMLVNLYLGAVGA